MTERSKDFEIRQEQMKRLKEKYGNKEKDSNTNKENSCD